MSYCTMKECHYMKVVLSTIYFWLLKKITKCMHFLVYFLSVGWRQGQGSMRTEEAGTLTLFKTI